MTKALDQVKLKANLLSLGFISLAQFRAIYGGGIASVLLFSATFGNAITLPVQCDFWGPSCSVRPLGGAIALSLFLLSSTFSTRPMGVTRKHDRHTHRIA